MNNKSVTTDKYDEKKKFQFSPINTIKEKDDEIKVSGDNFMIPKKVCIRKSPEQSNYKIRKSCKGEILNIYEYYVPINYLG